MRYKVWAENLDFIEKHNAGNSSAIVGINKFSDWTTDEFNYMAGGANKLFNKIPDAKRQNYTLLDPTNNPSSVDWRSHCTTPMNQG